MSRRPRRNHAPAFKAKVALDALKGDQTIVELSQRYQVHPNQITEWKKQLLERAADVFSMDRKPEQGPSVKVIPALKFFGYCRQASMERGDSLLTGMAFCKFINPLFCYT